MTITEDQSKFLEEPLTDAEIATAIKNQKKRKSPGPDGILAEFYCITEDNIIPYFKELLNEIRMCKKYQYRGKTRL